MRYAFGLVGLLVGFAIIAWLMSGSAQTASEVRKKVEPEVRQIAGQSADGTRADKSAALQAQHDGSGKFTGLLAVEVVDGGAYETHFGLKQYDLIVQVGPLDFRTLDEEMAKAQMIESYQRNQEIVVLRGGKRLILPQPAGTSTPAVTASPAPAPAAKPPAPHGLQGQLEGIQQQSVPTH